MTSSSRDPAAIPTRRDPLTARLALIFGFALCLGALLAWDVAALIHILGGAQ